MLERSKKNEKRRAYEREEDDCRTVLKRKKKEKKEKTIFKKKTKRTCQKKCVHGLKRESIYRSFVFLPGKKALYVFFNSFLLVFSR